MGPALIPAAFLLVLALLGSSKTEPSPSPGPSPGPGPDAGPDPDADDVGALCQALRGRGDVPPLAPSEIAEQDLAIRAAKILGLSGTWPPRPDAPQAIKDYWAKMVSLARLVRSGELVCDVQPGPGPTPGPDPDPSFDSLRDEDLLKEACALWLSRLIMATPAALALALARGLYPQLAWPGPVGSNRAYFFARATALFEALESGEMSCDSPIQPETVPRADSYYQWRKDDLPFQVVAKAYPQLAGNAPGQAQKRIAAVKMITNHPRNGGGVLGQGIIIKTKLAGDIKMLGPVIFSTDPKWYCNPTTEAQRFTQGGCYAVVYLPPI